MTPDIVLTTNSPGELSSWVRVASAELLQLEPRPRLHVALVPCPFAAGSEYDYARALPGLETVLRPSETLKLLLGLPGFHPGPNAMVVFLGGELWQASNLAKRWKVPSVAYATRASGQARPFTRLAVPNEELIPQLVAKGIPRQRIECVGDLMVDGVALVKSRQEARQALGLSPEVPVIGLFPGSRTVHLRAALPLFLRAAEHLAARIPEAEFLLVLSPFVSLAGAQQALDQPIDVGVERAYGRFTKNGLITSRGLPVRVTQGRPHESIGALDLAMSVPGTNTAELSCVGCPMVTVLSVRAPLPRGGLGGIVELLPFQGLKDRFRLKEYSKFPHGVAQPNLRARRRLVPEVMLDDSLDELVGVLAQLLEQTERRLELSGELRQLMGATGAGRRLGELIWGTLGLGAKREQYA